MNEQQTAETVFFAITRNPRTGAWFAMEEDDESGMGNSIFTWPTEQACREAIKDHPIVKAHGAKIFEIACGVDV